MKILHINSYYSGSNFYKNFYDKQKKNGLDIEVYVPIRKKMYLSNYNLGDYTTISENHNKIDRFLFYFKHKKILKDIVKKYMISDYSILHAHSLFSNGYIAMKLKEEFGIPYIVAVRNTDVNVFFEKMVHLRNLGVKILKEAEKVIFLSESYRDDVINRFVPDDIKNEVINKVVVVPNGIDDFWFNNINNNYKAKPHKKKLRLLYIGAIDKNKNILTTVESIKNYLLKKYDVEFTIVGQIGDKKIYKKVINLPFIQHIPTVKKEELIKIYQENDIFVMPSIHETFGLVYAEAMSQGLPIIYSKRQGFDGQFSEGLIGFSVKSTSAEEISNKVEEIVMKYEVLSKNCVREVLKFNWNKINADYIKIYSECEKKSPNK